MLGLGTEMSALEDAACRAGIEGSSHWLSYLAYAQIILL